MYDFIDLGNLACAQIVKVKRPLILGRIAVCTSFDSGRYINTNWTHIDGYYVSPVINDELIDHWPISHDQYCDEWWIFDQSLPAEFNVVPFCNFIGMRITDYQQLNWNDGCPLDDYLARFRPRAILGNNDFAYWIHQSNGVDSNG